MKKKILVFVDWYEPGYKAGGPVQSCKNFVAAMQEYFDFYIITSDRDLGDQQPYTGISTNQWTIKNKNVQIYYASEKELTVARLVKLSQFVNPDYIYLNSMYSYHFTVLPLWLERTKKINAKIVIAPRGMLQEGAIQFKSFKKKAFVRILNFSGIPKKLRFHATDDQEKKDILKYFPSPESVFVITNFPRTGQPEWKSVPKDPGHLDCIFISRIVPKKNILFILNIFSELHQNIKLHFSLRGDIEDNFYWEKCSSVIKTLPENISVNWDGPVANEQVPQVLSRYHLFILPTKGENFGHAIFESLSSGKPVLISDQTPWRNLKQKKIGWDLPLNEPRLFLEAIEQVAAFNQQEYDQWSQNAWTYARNYSAKLNLKEDYLKLFS